MSNKLYRDANSIEYKYIGLEQYDYYDYDNMAKMWHKYDKRIGGVLIQFGELEQSLDGAIAFLVSDRSDDLGYRITMDLSFGQKVKLFNRLCKIYLKWAPDTDDASALKDVVDRLIAASQVRNIVAHAKWMTLDEDGFVRSRAGINDEAEVHFKYYRLTPKVLYHQERKIRKIDVDFTNFLDKNNLI